jgi:hypothetical protein
LKQVFGKLKKANPELLHSLPYHWTRGEDDLLKCRPWLAKTPLRGLPGKTLPDQMRSLALDISIPPLDYVTVSDRAEVLKQNGGKVSATTLIEDSRWIDEG